MANYLSDIPDSVPLSSVLLPGKIVVSVLCLVTLLTISLSTTGTHDS